MTNKFTKTVAVAIATVSISTAVLSSSASARMGGHMGHMGHMGGMERMGHGHMERGHMGGFGRGAAIGFAAGMLGAIIAANAAPQPWGESYNPETGERIRSEGPRGRHVITRTNREGKVIEKTVNKPGPSFASTTDPKTGVTTTVTLNGDGTRTVTQTAADGSPISSQVVK
ncbi:MAG TPA: hypothetical protein VHD14_08145 [Pseudolabrys sp.]|nr:hypothetical protein [Pseudolabrys sp.]